MNRIDLTDRVAIVTGAASGLGYATAERLIQSGARVTLWDLDADRTAEAAAQLSADQSVAHASVNIADHAAVTAAMNIVADREGRLDILINSAGISGFSSPTADLSLEMWDRQLSVNLSGAFYCCRAAIPIMRANGYGRIVLVSSAAGKDGNPFQAAYSAAKAGVIGLTKSLGKELAADGIVVNCVAPTVFDTPMHKASVARLAPGLMDAIKAKIPFGRVGIPNEFAAMVAWLVSEECSYTTGFTFDLTGGRSTY